MAGFLSAAALGSIVKIKENGVNQEFYVAKHGYPTDGNGRTLLVRKYAYNQQAWNSLNKNVPVNAYEISSLDNWLNTTYLDLLTDVKNQISEVSIPYTPMIGNVTSLRYLARGCFILSTTEAGGTGQDGNIEGTALSLPGINLKILTTSADTAVGQWTRTPRKSGTTSAVIFTATGGISNLGVGYTTGYYVRPAFTLPSALLINDSGEVVVNTAPVISYSGSTALGEKTEGFTVQYSVSDIDNDAVTVTERIGGVVKRSYKPTLGANQQFQAVLPANFQTVLNGTQTLTIEATDGKAAAVPKTITFTKTVYGCNITLTTPLAADGLPTAMRMSISGSIPADAVWTAQVCNNGNDASPTWEDIKPAMLGGFNHVFANKTKTAPKWGVNFVVDIRRGPSNTGGYVTSIEGGFM